MAGHYTSSFTKPYANGWQNGIDGETPILANILNNYDTFYTTIDTWAVNADNFLDKFDWTMTPLSGEIWLFNSTTGKFETGPIPTQSLGIGDLTDVDFPRSLANGQVLTYDSTSEKWENKAPTGGASALNDLTDVTISSATNGQILKYNSSTSKWENSAESTGATTLNGLTDVTISSATNGQVLKYNSSAGKWVNGADSGGSVVSVTQLTSSGTNIADITIDGATTHLYAPTAGGSGWTDVTGTLAAGSTSITLSDASITTSSTIDIYTDLDVPYNSKTLSNGSITITFDAQQSNMAVKVRVS